MLIRSTIVSLAVLAVAGGCGTVNQTYRPSHLGNLADNKVDRGVEVYILPDKYRARIGDPLSFKVVIKNVSSEPILLPVEPDLVLTWIYPDGKRDNIIRGPKKKVAVKYRTLAPGESIVENSVITTYYFDRPGIHEFRAILRGDEVAMSTHPQSWNGRAVSNGFGVMFEGN